MRKIYTLLLTTMLIFGLTNVNAQDKNNQWQFSFGTNAVDLEVDQTTTIPDFFDVDQNWNVSKSPLSMFSLSKYVGDNVEFEVSLITSMAMDKELRFAIREGGHTVGAGVVTEIVE